MEIVVIKLVCLAILVGIFAATVALTPWIFGQSGRRDAAGSAEARRREALTRP